MDGGLDLALICLNAFLPNIHLQVGVPDTRVLNDGESIKLTNFVVSAEKIIGHEFRNKGLLFESLTHPTCERVFTHTESYQLFEFLGDAVLDMVVVGTSPSTTSLRVR
jgi:hypothetical protein